MCTYSSAGGRVTYFLVCGWGARCGTTSATGRGAGGTTQAGDTADVTMCRTRFPVRAERLCARRLPRAVVRLAPSLDIIPPPRPRSCPAFPEEFGD